MRFRRFLTLIIIILILMSSTVLAENKYIKDSAGVLASNTINKVEANLAKIENSFGIGVKIILVKSLEGTNITEYADEQIKASPSTDNSTNKSIVFVVSTQDRKNKFVVGEGLNSIFSSAEIDRIASLPNQYFKNNDFDTGILKVGEAIDVDITTRTSKISDNSNKDTTDSNTSNANSGNDTSISYGSNRTYSSNDSSYRNIPVSNSYNRSYRNESSDSPIPFILLGIFVVIVIASIKSRTDNSDYNSNARRNNNYNTSNSNNNGRRYTTISNNNSRNNNDFVEGMIVGEMLSDHKHHNHDHHNHNHNHNSDHSSLNNDDENKVSTCNWDSSSSTSSWDSSSSSSSSSDSVSSCDSGSSGGSDW